MKALDEGKYEAAAQAFRKAIEADPKDYFAHFNLAMAFTLLAPGSESISRISQDAGAEAGTLRGGVERRHRAAAPEESGGSAAAVRGRRAAEAAGIPATLLSGRIASYRPATTPRRRRATSWPSAWTRNRRARNSAWRRRWCSRASLPMPTLLPPGGAAGAEVSRTTCWSWRGSTKRPRRIAKPSRSTASSRTTRRRRRALGELLLETKQFEDAVPRLEEALRKGSQPSQPHRAGGSLRVHAASRIRRCRCWTIGSCRTRQLRFAHDVRARAAR